MTAPVALRNSRPKDADAMGLNLCDFINTTPRMPSLNTVQQCRGCVARMITVNQMRLVEPGGSKQGFADCDNGELRALDLQPTARGKGGGSASLEEQMVPGSHLWRWTSQAKIGARTFYGRQGFADMARTNGANAERLPDIQPHWKART